VISGSGDALNASELGQWCRTKTGDFTALVTHMTDRVLSWLGSGVARLQRVAHDDVRGVVVAGQVADAERACYRCVDRRASRLPTEQRLW
jgi:hypothetical protein